MDIKKLDDRSRALVHLGTEPGSKAYRMFDPTHRKIVVSRDVHFDETKQWEWNLSVPNIGEEQPGIFKVTFGEYGNNDIQEEHTEEEEEAGEGHSNEEPVNAPETVIHNDENATIPLRRSTRITKPPSYLGVYVQLTEEEGCEYLFLLIDDKPWSFGEAIKNVCF